MSISIAMKKEYLLVPREKYLSAGVHIGMNVHTSSMARFIYKIRPDGLAVLNIGLIDRRINHAINMIARSRRVLVIVKKDVVKGPATVFAESIGADTIVGRFMPGSLTNPGFKEFYEPDLLLVTDPKIDKQAMKEAVKMRIPIIGLTDTFNETSFIDLAIPCNNKGKKSVSLILWIIAKGVAEKQGITFDKSLEDFGYG